MTTTLSSESTNWILPSNPTKLISTIPNYEESMPIRVNREGITNYVKNRGTLQMGDHSTDARRMSASTFTETTDQKQDISGIPRPKIKGPDATRNYTRGRSSTPNLIYSNLQPPDPHHCKRVKEQGRANYERNQHCQMKALFENYGKSSVPNQSVSPTQNMVTNIFYSHQEGRMGSNLNKSTHVTSSPRPVPHVKGIAAETNLHKGYGDSRILEHGVDCRPISAEPHIKGIQAHLNYDMGQGRHVDKLFHEYGKLPQSGRAPPRVKYGGVENFIKSQGEAMRKTISQCPPSTRFQDRT